MAKKVVGPVRTFPIVNCPSCKYFEKAGLVMYCNKIKMPMRIEEFKPCYHYDRAADTDQENKTTGV